MTNEAAEKVSRDDLLRMAVDIVAAYVSRNPVSLATRLPAPHRILRRSGAKSPRI